MRWKIIKEINYSIEIIGNILITPEQLNILTREDGDAIALWLHDKTYVNLNKLPNYILSKELQQKLLDLKVFE